MEEKGRPWLSKLGVATETTGVVSEWVDWETPRRWALFCKRKQSVRGGRCVGCFTQVPHSKAHLGNSRPRWDASTWRPQRYTHTQVHTEMLKSTDRNVHTQMYSHLHMCKGEGAHAGPVAPAPAGAPPPLSSWLAPPSATLQHTACSKRAGMCEGNAGPGVACACVYARTCVGLSAPSAAESLVYSNSTVGPKLPPCWPPKPACLFQPLWPPVREMGGGGRSPCPTPAEGEYVRVCA